MLHPTDVPADYPQRYRLHRVHYEREPVTVRSALRNGDTGFALFSTVVSLVVIFALVVFA